MTLAILFAALLSGNIYVFRADTIDGKTDDLGYFSVEDPIHVHDLNATILHLMGMDHTWLTYKHLGRDFRFTDVHGKVVTKIFPS